MSGLRVEVDREGRPRYRPVFGAAEVDVPLQRSGRQAGHVDRNCADLRPTGAGDARNRAVDPSLGRRAGFESVGGRLVHRHAFGQRHARDLQLRRVDVFGIGVVGKGERGGEAVAFVGLCGFRLQRVGGFERRFHEGFFAVTTFGLYRRGVFGRGGYAFVGFAVPARGRLGPRTRATRRVGQEADVADVPFEAQARSQQPGCDVLDFEVVVVVRPAGSRRFGAPFDIAFDEGVGIQAETWYGFGHLDSHPEQR